MQKRKARDDAKEQDQEDTEPRKTRRTLAKEDGRVDQAQAQAETPSGRKSILKGTPSKANGVASVEPTPKSLRKVLFSTPSRAAEVAEQEDGDDEPTPTATRNDRSARRKSARVLQQRREDEGSEDEEEVEREAEIARQILDDDEEEEKGNGNGSDGDGADADEADEIAVSTTPTAAPDTPSKRGRPRGRPKKKERTPSPPPDLPPHELYFFQNRAGANKTSANTLPSNLLLHHEDYFTQIHAYEDPHARDIERLQAWHARAFEQWGFELDEGFNLCLYGYGSKRGVVMRFVDHLYAEEQVQGKIVVVNGYTPALTIRDVITTLSSAVAGKGGLKLPANPGGMLDMLLSHLDEHTPKHPLTLVIHSLDHPNLRKHQPLLARLTASPHIRLLVTVDNPNFPLLWDTTLLRHFNWLYHDCTTFAPYAAEIEVVEAVNELLGRKGRRLGGKDGVVFVLRSLPENARALFRILVAEQLAAAPADGMGVGGGGGGDYSDYEDEEMLGASDDERAAEQQDTPSRRGKRGRGRPAKKAKLSKPRPAAVSGVEGVEYRTLYHKAVEEFVCTSEMNFRTLLKEFYDHQMVESRRDGGGTERLVVPFEKAELEGLLEEIT